MAVREVYAAGISDDVSSRKADNTIPLHHTLFSLFSWEGTHTHIAASGCKAGKRNNQVKKKSHVFFAFSPSLRSGTWTPLLLVVTRVLAPKASRPITHRGVLFARLRRVDPFLSFLVFPGLSFYSIADGLGGGESLSCGVADDVHGE